MTIEDLVHRTMSDVNRAIMQWFNGALPDSDDGFESVTRLCHPDMTYVFPAGSVQNARAFLADLRGAHGTNPAFRLATPRPYTRLLYDDTVLVAAEITELQDGAKFGPRPRHARRTTILCVKDRAGPHGLRLWRLHESYVPKTEETTLDWSALDG